MSAARALCFSLLAWCCGATAAGDCTAVESPALPESAKALMQAFTQARLVQPVLAEEAIYSNSFPELQQEELQQPPTVATMEAPPVPAPQQQQVQAPPAQLSVPFLLKDASISTASEATDPQVAGTELAGANAAVNEGMTGELATLDEEGFQVVKQLNSEPDMVHFIRKLIREKEGSVCDDIALKALVQFYNAPDNANNFQMLVEEINRAANASCPWVGTAQNEWCSPTRTIGATATIDEPGYLDVKKENCFAITRHWLQRAAETNGYHVCSDGALSGMTMYYYKADSPANYAWLQQELATAAGKDCPWVVRHGFDCPALDENSQCISPPVPAQAPQLLSEEPATPTQAEASIEAVTATGAAPDVATVPVDASIVVAPDVTNAMPTDAAIDGASEFAVGLDDMSPDAATGASAAVAAAPGGPSAFAIGIDATGSGAAPSGVSELTDTPPGADADAAPGTASEFAIGMDDADGSAVDAASGAASGYMDDTYGSAIDAAADAASSSAASESASRTDSQSVGSAGKTIVHTYDGDSASSQAEFAASSVSEDDEFTVEATSSSSAGNAKEEVTSSSITYEDDLAAKASSKDAEEDTVDLDEEDFHVGTSTDSHASKTESTSSTSATSKKKSTSGTAANSTRKGSALAASTSKGTSNSSVASKVKSDARGSVASKAISSSNTSANSTVKSNSSAAAATAKVKSNSGAAAASTAKGTSSTSAAAKVKSNSSVAAASKVNGSSNASAATKIRSNSTVAAASKVNGTSNTSAATKIRSNSTAAAASNVNGTSSSAAALKTKDNSTAVAASKSKSNSSASQASKVRGSNTATMNETRKAKSSASADSKSSTTADSTDKASSGVDEETFKALKKKDDPKKMINFMGKLINTTGFELCAEGGLNGLVHFYVGDQYPTANFKRLNEEIKIAAQSKKCPWVVKKGEQTCPEFAKCWR